MSSYALGRQPADPTKPKLRLNWALGVRPAPPESCDWLSAVPQWSMALNDRVGDCTAAGAAHVAVAVDKYGQGRDLTITDDQVLEMYRAISGYDPANPATDVGATLQDACNYWHQTGVAGNTIAAYAWIDPQDIDLVRAAIATFGAVYTGFWVTAAAMNQFNNGQTWTTTSKASRVLGGHCVPIGAYDSDSFTAVTWGRTQKMSTGFFRRWFDEVIVPVDLDWMRANGTSPAGLDVVTLNADYEALTGQPGPFPDYVPPPPSPDVELVAAIDKWRSAKQL